MMQVSKTSVVVKTILSLLFALIWVFPVVWLVLSSFKPGSELFTFPLTLFPKDFSLSGYISTFSRYNVFRATYNTAFITFFATVITLIMGSW